MQATVPDPRPWPFVGRGRERAAVLGALTGQAELVGLVGDPGIGKTTLLLSAAGDLDRRHWDVVRISGSEAAASTPLAAVVPLLGGSTAGGTDSVFAAAAAAVLDRTRRRRLALIVDDAHLLDPVSAALVEWVVADTEASVGITARAVPLPDGLARLRRERPEAWLDLAPLTRREVHRLIVDALGGRVDGVTVERVWTVTRGNPLFVREVLAAARRDGVLTEDAGVWRWSRRAAPMPADLVAANLAALPADARAALELLAGGEPLPLPVVEAAVPAATLTALDRAGLLSVDDPGAMVAGAGPSVRCAHPIHGETLRAGMSALRRRQVHRELVAALDRPELRDAVGPLRYAAWAVTADVPLDPELLTGAAREALRRYDLGLAERLAHRAVRAGAGWDGAQLLAEVYTADGTRYAEAEAAAAEALRLADTPRRRTRSLLTAATTSYWRASAGGTAAAGALAELDGDAADEPVVTAMRGSLAMFDGRPELARRLSTRLLERPDLTPGLRRWARRNVVFASVALGRAADALALAEEELAAEVADGSAWSRQRLVWGRCIALAALGRLAEAAELADLWYAEGVRRQLPEQAGVWSLFAGQVGVLRGELAAAAGHFREAAALLGEQDRYRSAGMSLVELATVLAQAGAAREAAAVLARAEARRDRLSRFMRPAVALAAGWLALATGERAEAVRHVRDAASTAAADGDRVMEVRALHAAARFGRPELALPRLAALAGEVDGPWPALAHRHAAALMAGDGPALDAVAEDFAGLGAHLLAAEAGRAAAVAHRREGLPGRAAGSAGRAAGWLRLCGDPAAPTLPALDGPELTPREQEVVELAAAGWSSRSIAQRLDVSVRTVDNHLGRAYRKLGTTGRDELRASSGTGSQDPR